eukprot:3398949-Lingulodinium_polyedra.AAC.1
MRQSELEPPTRTPPAPTTSPVAHDRASCKHTMHCWYRSSTSASSLRVARRFRFRMLRPNTRSETNSSCTRPGRP